MDDQLLFLTLMFGAVLILAAYVLLRIIKVMGKKGDEGVDLTVRRRSSPRYQLRRGSLYLLLSQDPTEGLKIMRGRHAQGDLGLLITRTHPSKVKENFHFKPARTIWLSRNEKKGGMNPTSLGPLLEETERFMRKRDRPCVVISDLDYLLEQNEFRRVCNFIESMREVAEAGTGRFLMVGSLQGLDEEQAGLLLKEVKTLGGGKKRPRRRRVHKH